MIDCGFVEFGCLVADLDLVVRSAFDASFLAE